jgi:hypothetical protein
LHHQKCRDLNLEIKTTFFSLPNLSNDRKNVIFHRNYSKIKTVKLPYKQQLKQTISFNDFAAKKISVMIK